MKMNYDDPAIRIAIASLAVGIGSFIVGVVSLLVALDLAGYAIDALVSGGVGAALARGDDVPASALSRGINHLEGRARPLDP